MLSLFPTGAHLAKLGKIGLGIARIDLKGFEAGRQAHDGSPTMKIESLDAERDSFLDPVTGHEVKASGPDPVVHHPVVEGDVLYGIMDLLGHGGGILQAEVIEGIRGAAPCPAGRILKKLGHDREEKFAIETIQRVFPVPELGKDSIEI
jgi:hypothetical protein